MSRRKLVQATGEERKKAYRQMDHELLEAIWEILEHLDGQGIRLGPKFRQMQRRRGDVKTRFPKRNK